MTAFAENVKKYRLQKGYTQSELGEKLFVAAQTVCKWEKGESEPNFGTLLLLCDALEVTPSKLLSNASVTEEELLHSVSEYFISETDLKSGVLAVADEIVAARGMALSGELPRNDFYRITNRHGFFGTWERGKHFSVTDTSRFSLADTEKASLQKVFSVLGKEGMLDILFNCGKSDGWYDLPSAAILLGVKKEDANGIIRDLVLLSVAQKREINVDGKNTVVYSFFTEKIFSLLAEAKYTLLCANRYIW